MKPQAKRPWVRPIASTALIDLVAAGCGVTDHRAASPENSATVHQTNPSIPDSQVGVPELRRVSAEESVRREPDSSVRHDSRQRSRCQDPLDGRCEIGRKDQWRSSDGWMLGGMGSAGCAP